jgi:CTP synthase
VVHERHRHRYEVNNHYRPQLVDAGLVVAGTFQEGRLVEVVELPDHPWFVASQFHPEFKSRPERPHPLFFDFVAAANQRYLSHAEPQPEAPQEEPVSLPTERTSVSTPGQ